MGLYETEAIVLKSFGLAEADKIVVFLTKEQGLVRGVAKGAKRLKSRFGSSLEPLSLVRLFYFQKDDAELVSIRECELLRSIFESASHPRFFQKFAYISELLNDFAPPSDPNERLYRMAKVCLETSAEQPDKLDQMVLYFELWILKLGGFLPSWEKCIGCQREFAGSDFAGLQINFQLVCRVCQKNRSALTVSVGQRELFNKAQCCSPARFIDVTGGKLAEVRELSIILKRIISTILGKVTVGERILPANY